MAPNTRSATRSNNSATRSGGRSSGTNVQGNNQGTESGTTRKRAVKRKQSSTSDSMRSRTRRNTQTRSVDVDDEHQLLNEAGPRRTDAGEQQIQNISNIESIDTQTYSEVERIHIIEREVFDHIKNLNYTAPKRNFSIIAIRDCDKLQVSGINWLPWKAWARNCLQFNECIGIVDGSEQCPIDPIRRQDWEDRSHWAMMQLWNCLSSELWSFAPGEGTAYELWCYLNKRFQNSCDSSRRKALADFHSLRMGDGDPLSLHIEEFRRCWNACIQYKYTIDEPLAINILLNSLPRSYSIDVRANTHITHFEDIVTALHAAEYHIRFDNSNHDCRDRAILMSNVATAYGNSNPWTNYNTGRVDSDDRSR
jgi:hypothetical protein